MSTPLQSYPFKTAWHDLLADLDRYRITDHRSYLTMFIICPGSFASVVYRLGRWIWSYSGRFAGLVLLLRPFFIILQRFNEIVTGISITPRAHIGSGLYIGHFGGIIVGESVVMGTNCNLSQGVTLGISGRGEKQGSPILGNRVYIAPGAKIFGKIIVGNDVAIGANAVVTKSLPDCAVAVGIPAKVISSDGSFEYILYRTMETDPERLANLRRADSQEAQQADITFA